MKAIMVISVLMHGVPLPTLPVITHGGQKTTGQLPMQIDYSPFSMTKAWKVMEINGRWMEKQNTVPTTLRDLLR